MGRGADSEYVCSYRVFNSFRVRSTLLGTLTVQSTVYREYTQMYMADDDKIAC